MPSRRRWATYLWLGLLLDLLFLAIYGGTAYLNHYSVHRFHLYAEWERTLPLMPEFVYPYFSLLIMLLLPPFALNETALTCLAKQCAIATLSAGLLFLLLPTQTGFTHHLPDGSGNALIHLLYSLDLPLNLFPSLHIIYSTLLVMSLAPFSPGWFRLVLYGWLALLCLSVLLVHQHHVADIVGGLLMAYVIGKEMWIPNART